MSLRLPPLNTLRMFESAGRHLSFAEAAAELGVTRSAVGHGVNALEGWLGVPLFQRTARGLVLTEAGRRYLPAVARSLSELAAAVEATPGRPTSEELRITVSPTFASRILLPRLADLKARLGGVKLRIDTSHHVAEFPRDGLDLAIRVGTGQWHGLECIRLAGDILQPVAAPGLAASLGEDGKHGGLPVIRVSSVSHDWDLYLRESAQTGRQLRTVMVVDTIELAMRATSCGLGVALGHWPFYRRELEAGTLVRLSLPPVSSPASSWLVGRPETFLRPDVARFRAWAQEVAAELAATPYGG